MIWVKYPHFLLFLFILGHAVVLAGILIGVERLRRRRRSRRGEPDRPSKYMEELIKDRLSKEKHKRPKLVSRGRRRYGRLQKLARSRPQPAVRGTYDWGQQIGQRQREVEHILSGRK